MSKVVIDELVKARLSTLVKNGVEGGWLVGLFVDGVPHVFGVLGCAGRNDDEESEHIQRMLPVGVQLCGIWVSAEPSAAKMVDYLLDMKVKATPDVSDMANVWGGRLWTFWLQQEVEGGGWAATSIDEKAGFQPQQLQLSWTSFQQAPLLPAELQPACFPLLFTADVTLNVFPDAKGAADAEVAAAVDDAAARASAALDATEMFLLSSHDWGHEWGRASGVLLNRSEADSRSLSSCGASGTFQGPSRLQPVCSCSATDQGEAAVPAPAFAYAHAAASALAWSVPVALEVVVLAPPSVAAARLLQRLVLPAAQLQLAAAAALLKRIPPQHWPLLQLRACHYQPQAFLAHRVSAIVPVARPDAAADVPAKELKELAGLGVEMRMEMHRRLGLPLDRPLLRPEAAVTSAAAGAPSALVALSAGGRLRDVHEGMRPSGVAGGVQYMVDGSYFYFHYMQDSFDDNGWGCAYRSLQTLWSWFILQGYTQQAVPGIRSIQKLLVEADPSTTGSLIGSKQWLGSIELATVLQHGLGLDYRIIFVPSGAGMAGKAREIATHFSQVGTPIMVGGGVLAYTLLGIDWNESTGEVAFLILDPHYTGQDDIKKVHKGSWVSWKRPGDKAAAGGDLFVTSSHYNLLCPQRPSTV